MRLLCCVCRGWAMKSTVVKRSVVVAGHKTSVSLEDEFWKGLREIADGRAKTLSDMVATIDADRQQATCHQPFASLSLASIAIRFPITKKRCGTWVARHCPPRPCEIFDLAPLVHEAGRPRLMPLRSSSLAWLQ